MKIIITILIAIISLNVIATTKQDADFPNLGHLKSGDTIWYSNDSQTWFTANFVYYIEHKSCTKFEPVENEVRASVCDRQQRSVGIIWYDKPQHPDNYVIRYVRPYDPNSIKKPSKDELLGLLTRFQNLMFPKDLEASYGTAKGLIRDRDDLMNRTTEIRKLINESEYGK